MNTKLHVGNLATHTTSATLAEVFQGRGTPVVSVQVVRSRDPKHSRGFAFVEMPSEAEAAAAVQAVDGAEVDGQKVRVSLAKPPKSRFD
jgi:cold-inducible RNA-binding protein